MANTPNLDLVKPAGTDHALVSVINSNSDKIDGGFGTLSEQIATYDFGTIASQSALESALVTYISNMTDGQFKHVRVLCNPAFGVFTNSVYYGTIVRYNSSRIHVEFYRADNMDEYIIGIYTSSTWKWDELALNSNKATIKCKSFTATTTANGNIDITSILNTYVYTVFAVSAHVKSSPSTMVVAIPYQYSNGRPNKINGLHCISETASGEVIASTEIEGMIFYVDNNTITQE